MNFFRFFAAFFLVALYGCQQEILEERLIYSNDFTSLSLDGIESDEGINIFHGDTVLGFFNNGGFKLSWDNLPKHNMVRVTVDLYLHDSWDGNTQGIDGPDIWVMEVDGLDIIRTTFSNSACESTYCLYQSFPENYVRVFQPKTGALNTALPGRCAMRGVPNWTSHYRVSKTILHQEQSLVLSCFDEMVQTNWPDMKCDESWSVSKIEVSLLEVG
jgi:hypothetical protein